MAQGSFIDGVMETGQECVMVDLEEDENGVKIPVIERSNSHSDHVHRFKCTRFLLSEYCKSNFDG